MKVDRLLKLIASLLLPLGIGGIAGAFTTEAIPGWYATLIQPSFNPPNWVFGPVWTSLYILMGISFYLIWKTEASKVRNRAILLFLVHLLLNFCWSFLFFYFKMIGLALLDIIALWIMIVVVLVHFYKIKPMAAYINIPYLVWVSFATALNMAYFFLNRNG
jgi:tryptophan-rich sensory protein